MSKHSNFRIVSSSHLLSNESNTLSAATQDLGHAILLAHAQPVLLAAISQTPIPLSRQVSHLSLSAAQLTATQVCVESRGELVRWK